MLLHNDATSETESLHGVVKPMVFRRRHLVELNARVARPVGHTNHTKVWLD
jgi:hypothetical protein